MRFKSLGVFALVAACGVPPTVETQQSDVLSARIASETQTNLCLAAHDTSTTPRGKLMIEAELAVRGVTQCSGESYGSASAAAFGSTLYDRQVSAPQSASRDLRNCSDFTSGAAAQKYFLATGGPINDPNNLDGDGDGLACEWGAQVKRIAAYRKPVAAPIRISESRSSGSRCYTGPRGGTYTLTASGNKNYGGC